MKKLPFLFSFLLLSHAATATEPTPDPSYSYSISDDGTVVTTTDSAAKYVYEEIFYQSDLEDGDDATNRCEQVIEFWRPKNWDGSKAILIFHGGGWGRFADKVARSPNGLLTTLGRENLQTIDTIPDASDKKTAVPFANWAKDSNGETIIPKTADHTKAIYTSKYWMDKGYLVMAPTYTLYSPQDMHCNGDGDENVDPSEVITWEHIAHDAELAYLHSGLYMEWYIPNASSSTKVSILGISAGGYLAAHLATHGGRRIWDSTYNNGANRGYGKETIDRVVLFQGATDFAEWQSWPWTSSPPYLSAQRTLPSIGGETPSGDRANFDGCFASPALNLLFDGSTDLLDLNTTCGSTYDPEYEAFQQISDFHPFVRENTFKNHIDDVYGPEILLIHGSKDETIPPEMSINFCHSIADAFNTSASLVGSVYYTGDTSSTQEFARKYNCGDDDQTKNNNLGSRLLMIPNAAHGWNIEQSDFNEADWQDFYDKEVCGWIEGSDC